MNTLIALLSAVLVAAITAHPAEPSDRPSGRLILLPALPAQTPDSEPQKESARLLDSGEYYVLLEDGRLQMVKYTAAALKEEQPQQQQQTQEPQPFHYVQVQQQQQSPAPSQYRSPFPAGTSTFQQQQSAAPANLKVEYVQFPLPGSQFAQTKLQVTEDTKEADAEEVSGFEAKVEYHDVKPITAPVFAYNPAPLVRILKK